jgi:alpha-methylacyl-CoA racemase
MLLAFGVLAALFEAQRSGRGQVVDAAMTDGAALLSAMFYGLKAAGAWGGERGANLLDSGAHFYDTYRCADGKYVAVGAIEPQFYAELLQRLGLDAAEFKGQHDARRWPAYKARLAAVFASRSRAEWCALLEGSDACFAPVLDWDEAPRHPHHVARASFVEVDGVVQPAPAPRLQRTPAGAPRAPQPPLADAGSVLRAWAARADGDTQADSYNPAA